MQRRFIPAAMVALAIAGTTGGRAAAGADPSATLAHHELAAFDGGKTTLSKLHGDVVVVNFLNKKNAADQRVYELLDEKFRLFNGVFGASDEVLGAVESGVDFEKHIAAIYQQCRTAEQIERFKERLRTTLAQYERGGA